MMKKSAAFLVLSLALCGASSGCGSESDYKAALEREQEAAADSEQGDGLESKAANTSLHALGKRYFSCVNQLKRRYPDIQLKLAARHADCTKHLKVASGTVTSTCRNVYAQGSGEHFWLFRKYGCPKQAISKVKGLFDSDSNNDGRYSTSERREIIPGNPVGHQRRLYAEVPWFGIRAQAQKGQMVDYLARNFRGGHRDSYSLIYDLYEEQVKARVASGAAGDVAGSTLLEGMLNALADATSFTELVEAMAAVPFADIFWVILL